MQTMTSHSSTMEPQPDALDEREAARQRIRQELEEEHRARLHRFQSRVERQREDTEARRAGRERRRDEELREAERRRFHEEHGYREYVDSNGRREWLPPEEYAWRMKRRRKHDAKARDFSPAFLKRRQELALYAIAALLAMLVGLILAR